MCRVFFVLYFILVASHSFAGSPTTDDFVQKFCEYANVQSGEHTFLENVDSSDKLFPCYFGMGYSVPNKTWNVEQWSVDRNRHVSPEDVMKSAVIYFGFPLEAGSPNTNVYLKTLDNLAGVKPISQDEVLAMGDDFDDGHVVIGGG